MTPAADSPRPEHTPWHLRMDALPRWQWLWAVGWVTVSVAFCASQHVHQAQYEAAQETRQLRAHADTLERRLSLAERLCAASARLHDLALAPIPVPAPVVMEPMMVAAVRVPLTDPRLAEHGCSPEGDQLVCSEGRWWPEGRRP